MQYTTKSSFKQEYYNTQIPLEPEKVQLIIKSFEDGEYLYHENYNEHPTVTQNGKGASIWNFIHTELASNFKIPGYQTGIISRDIWDLLYVYDEKTHYLYTFMRDANFTNIQKRQKSRQLYHYSNVLSRLNAELLGTYQIPYEQMSFLDLDGIDEKVEAKLESLFKNMVSGIEGHIERYALVLVNCRRGQVKSIECVIPIAYTNPIYREDWSEFIKAEYDTEDYNVIEACPDVEEIALYANDKDIDLIAKAESVEGEDIDLVARAEEQDKEQQK